MSSVFLLTLSLATCPRSPPMPGVHLHVEYFTSWYGGWGVAIVGAQRMLKGFFFFLPEPVGLKEGCEYLCECHQVDGTVPELGWDAGWLRAHNTQPSAWHKSVTATETYPHAHKGAQCPVMRMHSHTHARRFSHLPHLARLVKTCRHPHQYARGRSRLRRSLEQLHNRT